MRLPDFIIGGAPRSGTTWLYQVLDRHPQIYMAKPARPEPKFFISDLYCRGLQTYAKWFEGAGEDQLVGEKTTNYLECGFAAERIHEPLPDIKMIFILRDPVERAWSNYLWSCMNGHETLSFEDACKHEPEREGRYLIEQLVSRPHSYISRGMYSDLLSPYIRYFGTKQLLVLRFEDVRQDPGDFAARVHNFLGVLPCSDHGYAVAQANAANANGLILSPRSRAYLQGVYREPNERLSRLLGQAKPFWSYA